MQREEITRLLKAMVATGGSSWLDVAQAVEQMRRAKIRNQLDSALLDLSITDLATGAEIATEAINNTYTLTSNVVEVGAGYPPPVASKSSNKKRRS